MKFEPPWLQMLLIAALSLGVIALSIDRTVEIGGSIFHFSELGTSTTNDAMLWVLTLAIAVPLILGSRPVEQRSVLAGVVVASFCYELLQASATVRYGADRWDEGSWFLVKILEIGCLSGAYWIARKRSGGSRPSATRYRIPLMAIAAASGLLLLLASHKEWSEASGLIGSVVPDRNPFALWVVLLAVPPIVASIAMAKRGTDAAFLSLATLASLGVLSYVAEANFLEESNFRLDGSAWRWLALSQLILAAVAWWAAIAGARSSAPSA